MIVVARPVCATTGKRRYRDRIDAAMVLARLGWKGRDERRVYRCPTCRGWHITSLPLNPGGAS